MGSAQSLQNKNAITKYSLQIDRTSCQKVCYPYILVGSFFFIQFFASLFSIGKATAVEIVYTRISVLRKDMVPKSIVFPTGDELRQVVVDFESLCFLPHCAGAIDGTFMEINKPTLYGDNCFCYKRFSSIIVLGTVDARDIFVNVNAGRPGAVGDPYCYRNSKLKQTIDSNQWLSPVFSRKIRRMELRPYLVADAAFPLGPTIMKCYEEDNLLLYQRSFNYAVIRTRRVVKQAFGRLKSRWRVMSKTLLNDPIFAPKVATVCCDLHNICERYKCPYEKDVLANLHDFFLHHQQTGMM